MKLNMPHVIIWKADWLPGSETFIRNQTSALQKWTHTCVGFRKVDSNLALDSDVIIKSRSPWTRLRHAVFALTGFHPAVKRYFRENRPDLIHVHFIAEARGIFHIATSLKIPLVVTVHGNDVTSAPMMGGIKGFAYRVRIRRAFRSASQVLAVSEFTAAKAISLGAPPEKVKIHHIGIPIKEVTPREETKYDLVFVGRLVPIKGVIDLIEAVRILKRRGRNDIRTVIVGDGPLRQSLEQAASNDNLPISFLGAMEPTILPSILSRSRIFVAPSNTTKEGHAEGFGMVFLEAAAQSLPVVAYRHGGVTESVKGDVTGLLVQEGNVPALADAIASLLDDETFARRLGCAGRARVVDDFDVQHQTALLENIYDSVLSGADK
jgi:colanic acid/amylovoran biosynthesis glycosyltransferase